MKINLKTLFIILITATIILNHWVAIDKSNEGRDIIWEPDDNYHQLIKAKNLDSCNKDCLAINNLLKYDNLNFNNSQKKKYDIYLHHTAIEYHFLFSKLLQVTNKYFNDWEKTFLFVVKIITSALVISFVIFISTFFNLRAGLISSIIILPYVQIKYGFHFSNGADELASIFGIFAIVALKNKKVLNYIVSIILSCLAVFSHPVGILMLIFNHLFLVIRDRKILNYNKGIYYFLSLLIVIFYFKFNLNYLSAEYNFVKLYNSFELNYSQITQLIILNLKKNLYFIYDLFNLLNFLILIFILIYMRKNLKIIFINNEYLKPLLIASIFIMSISLIHYAPDASLITRFQQILTLSFLSFYSVLINEFLIKIKKFKYKKIFIGLLVLMFMLHSVYNFNNLNLKIKSNQETLNLDFNTKEILKINERIDNSKPIIFKKNNSDESTFKSIYYKFLLEGFNEKNVYLDELFSSKNKSKFSNKNFLLIIPSPIIYNNLLFKEKRPNCFKLTTFLQCIERGWYGISRTRMSDLLIRNNDYLEIKSDHFINKLYLSLNTYGNNVILKGAEGKTINLKTHNQSKWFELNSTDLNLSKIEFNLSKDNFIKLNGIRTGEINYNWPWTEDIEISHDDNKLSRKYKFNIKKMIGSYFCEDFDIINDKRSFIIIDMKCQK